MKILSFDPSGNFNEGDGKTGWVYINDYELIKFGQVKAIDYTNRQEYWKAHTDLIQSLDIDIIILEDFRLYKNKIHSQINSEMETSKLLGYLEMFAYMNDYRFYKQMASQAKSRFNDKILIYKGYIRKDKTGKYYINGIMVSRHVIDALRHALLYKIKESKNGKR